MNVPLKIASVALAAATMVAAQPAPADAATWRNTGSPGVVEIPTTLAFKNVLYAAIGFGARSAWRSPAYSGTQTITITYKIFKWTGAEWRSYSNASASVSVAAGSRAVFGHYLPQVAMEGVYTVQVNVDWRTSGGTFLGSTLVDYNSVSDYAYGTPCQSCYISNVVGRGAISFFFQA